MVAAALLVVLWPFEAGAHRHRPGDLVESFVSTWNVGNADAMADLFDDNGDLYLPFSSYARGRTNIREMLRTIRFPELGTLELDRQSPPDERFFTSSLALFESKARLVSAGSVRARLRLSAALVPTKVSPTGEILEWSFTLFRMIRDESAAGK